MRGHGRSVKPDTPDGHTAALYAADFAAVSAAYGLVKPFFVGWSLGGRFLTRVDFIALTSNVPGTVATDVLTYLNLHPLAGIVYLNAFPSTADLAGTNTPFIKRLIPLLEDDSNVTSSKDSSISFVRACFSRPDSIPYSVLTSWVGMGDYQAPNVTKAVFSRVQNSTALITASKNGLKALLVQGTDDQLLDSWSLYQHIQAVFADLKVKWIKGGSHAAFYEERDQVVDAILGFLRAVNV
jgi:pimeloyl-ACP methyl ester carboxylesterase